MLLIATEDNKVQALDAATGELIWMRSLGRPVARSALRCGNINPLGVTGTPVIDAASEALYLDAVVEDSSSPHHRVFGLSLKDGAPLPGWPIDVANALRTEHQSFNARDQNERGALTVLDGTLYVPFGGHFGDCGDYHGWVVGISLYDPKRLIAWSTRSRGGGIWAPGGITVAEQSLFVATGNTFEASSWSDGEAIIRLAPDLHRSQDKRDFFAPSDWHALDERDADLGGSNPVPLDIQGSTGRQSFILALGKDGRAYLLNRNNLGGIGGSLVIETITPQPIRTAPAVTWSAVTALWRSGRWGALSCTRLGTRNRQRTRGPEGQRGRATRHLHRMVRQRAPERLADRDDDRWAFEPNRLDGRSGRRQFACMGSRAIPARRFSAPRRARS
jgi:hypothetical protein